MERLQSAEITFGCWIYFQSGKWKKLSANKLPPDQGLCTWSRLGVKPQYCHRAPINPIICSCCALATCCSSWIRLSKNLAKIQNIRTFLRQCGLCTCL